MDSAQGGFSLGLLRGLLFLRAVGHRVAPLYKYGIFQASAALGWTAEAAVTTFVRGS
jgi:hypothetical protein